MDTALFEAIRKVVPKRVELDFSAPDNRICMVIMEPYQPIRNDNAAFEAWVLYIHGRSPHTHIVLDIPPLSTHQYESLHFKRFLYRLAKFAAMDYSWFSLSFELGERVERFMEEYCRHSKIIRLPHSEAAGARGKGERLLQSRFSSPDSILYALPECDGAQIHTEFPVDLYWGKKRAEMQPENRVFPGGSGSRIDLWCAPEKCLSIFHLTYQEPTASVVSELFYYANWCRDVFIDSENCSIIFPRPPAKCYRGFADLFDENGQRRPIEHLNTCFLSDVFHPELQIDFVCEMLTTRDIHFHMLKYSWDMPIKFEKSNK